LIKAVISHLRVVTGARPPAGVLRLNYLLQQLLLRPSGLLLLGLQRLGDLGDGDEAIRLAEPPSSSDRGSSSTGITSSCG